MKGFFLKFTLNILKTYIAFAMILPFLNEIMKIEKHEICSGNFHDKKEYVKQIRNLRQTLNHYQIKLFSNAENIKLYGKCNNSFHLSFFLKCFFVKRISGMSLPNIRSRLMLVKSFIL